MKLLTACALAASLCGPMLRAQSPPYTIVQTNVPSLIRPYTAPEVAPARLANSGRLASLIRAGNLYLTVQDALALAIENNLNLEIARYGPQLADSALERARAGGPVRGVASASSQTSSISAGLGVNGSQQSAGVGGGGGSGGGGGAATVQQIGAITPSLDPSIQNFTTFGHLTQPQANTTQSRTNALIESVRTYNTSAVQRLLSGGSIQYTNFEQRLEENSPSDILNPAVGPHMDLIVQHSLLRGFGTRLNDRGIRISKVNITAARESFRVQLLNTVSQVLNLYWELAAAREDLRARERAQEITQKFVDDTKYEISVGALAGVELPRAEAELASRRQDVSLAKANVQQREISLKQALSRIEDPALESASVIPVDRMEVPENEDFPALRPAVSTALDKRPDVAVSKFRQQTAEMDLPGTTNPLLPSLNVRAMTFNRGTAGEPNTGKTPNPYFVGGYGTALGQIFRRNFPNQQITAGFSADILNRQAQADYGISQLQFRQSQLTAQRDTNQIVVDVASAISAVRQARSRYATARNTRILQEQLLEAERKRSSGPMTFNAIMIDQRGLITAQLAETSALTSYAHAKVALEQVLGETLENHNISLEEGLAGRIDRESRPPDVVEPPKAPPASK